MTYGTESRPRRQRGRVRNARFGPSLPGFDVSPPDVQLVGGTPRARREDARTSVAASHFEFANVCVHAMGANGTVGPTFPLVVFKASEDLIGQSHGRRVGSRHPGADSVAYGPHEVFQFEGQGLARCGRRNLVDP